MVAPQPMENIVVQWDIETIFPYKDRLFIGSNNAVYIYNASNGAKPYMESTFVHASGCDPVVCADDLAYVTINNGSSCGGAVNLLDVIDIKNPSAPVRLESYNMTHPKGLGLTEKLLFLCDDGLKIYDRSNPKKLKQLSHITNIKANDVIALNEKLIILIGEDGLKQYDTSDPEHPIELSKIDLK